MMLTQRLMKIYELLLERFSTQGWWPGDGRFETIVGAILTQNTNWGNVEKALRNLKNADSLDADKLYHMPQWTRNWVQVSQHNALT